MAHNGVESILPSELEGEQQAPEQVEEGDYVSALVFDCFERQVKDALEAALLPRAKALSAAMQHMNADAADVDTASNQELQDVNAELQRLTGLVMSFQQSISGILGIGPK